MIVDRFTKFLSSVIAIFLCLSTLNLWLSPSLVNAEATRTSEQPDKLNIVAFAKLADAIEIWAKHDIAAHEKSSYNVPVKTIDDAIIRLPRIRKN